MSAPSSLRQIAKRIAPLYHLVGLARRRRFRRDLAAENRRYAAGPSALPPPLLRYRVHGALDESSYLASGRALASRVVAAISAHGVDAGRSTILDFACGPGRVAAQVKALVPACRLHGSDIDVDAIAWTRAQLPEVGAFEVNAEAPPTRHADATFDVIYTVSFFTHVDEPAQLQWLAELARIVRPGGLVIASVHGVLARTSCTPAELAALGERGFAYRVDRKGRLKLDGLPDSYQTTFHSREYVMRTWSRWFEVVEYDEGGLAGHQDLVVVRR